MDSNEALELPLEEIPEGDGYEPLPSDLSQLPSPRRPLSVRRQKQATETDEVLFDRIASRRDAEAFSQFYDRFCNRVYALLVHMLRSEDDAQDLLQEVFTLVWQKAPLYLEQRGNVSSWVMSLARNRAVDELRSKRHREKSQETELLISEDRPSMERLILDNRTPDVPLHVADMQREISKALKTLSPEQRQIIDLSYFGGLTHLEISEQLQMPLGTVKTKLRQAVLKLGDLLRPLF